MNRRQQKGKGDLHVTIKQTTSTNRIDIIDTTSIKTSKTEKTTENRPYICEHCKKQFAYPSTLKRHVVIHTGQRDFKCNLCDYSASRKSNLNYHIRRHVYELPYKCSETDLSAAFVHASALKSHQLVHRKNDKSVEKLVCPQCPFKTHRKRYLTLHINSTHSSLRPFSCPHENCKYSAKTKSNLNQHLMTHSSEKPIVCPQSNCEFKTNRSSSLRDHIKTHTGEEKKNKCNYCDYASHRYRQLVEHYRTHTLETPYACESCSFRSKQKSNLKTHMKTHIRDIRKV